MSTHLVFSRDNRFLASADRDGNTFLWDLQAGKLLHHFKAKPQGSDDEFCHAFTPDGTVFIQARPDDITLWNAQKGKKIRRIDSTKEGEWPGGAAVSPMVNCWQSARFQQLWQDMQASDPRRAYAAIGTLVQSPGQAIDLLKKKIPSASKVEQKKLEQRIDELDSASYQVRENAMKELMLSAERAEAALRQALGRPRSLEAMRRVTRVLDQLPSAAPHPTTLATLRSLELLERINTPQVRHFIEQLSRGSGDPIQQREAEQTLKRLKRSSLPAGLGLSFSA